jgi:hypothetical protein
MVGSGYGFLGLLQQYVTDMTMSTSAQAFRMLNWECFKPLSLHV